MHSVTTIKGVLFACAYQSETRYRQEFAARKGLFKEMVSSPETGELALKDLAP